MNMNTVKITLLSLLSAAALCACSDDEAPTVPFTITEASLDFSARAAKGYVLVSDASCQASLTADWCRLERKADSILVYASSNLKPWGRTARLTLTSGQTVKELAVTQLGCYFEVEADPVVHHINDSTSSLSFVVSHTMDYTVSLQGQGMTHAIQGNTLMLNLEPNRTGQPRTARVSLYCPEMDATRAFTVAQYTTDDLMGSWTASYTNLRGEATTRPVQLSKDNAGKITLTGLVEGLTLPISADDKGHIVLETGSATGVYTAGTRQFNTYVYGVDGNHVVYTKEKDSRKLLYKGTFTPGDADDTSIVYASDSTFAENQRMQGIAISAYEVKSDGTVATSARTIEEFYGFCLKRP